MACSKCGSLAMVTDPEGGLRCFECDPALPPPDVITGVVTGKRDNVGYEIVNERFHVRVAGSEFRVSRGLYDSVAIGDEVIVRFKKARWYEIPTRPRNPRRVVSEIVITAQRKEREVSDPEETSRRERIRQERVRADELAEFNRWVEEFIEILIADIGVDAQALDQDPLSSGTSTPDEVWKDDDWFEAWIQITEGPISSVHLTSEDFRYKSAYFSVPDARIAADFPLIYVQQDDVKSFPIFGRVIGTRWGPTGGHLDRNRRLSKYVADSLNGDNSLSTGQDSSGEFRLRADPINRCWWIWEQSDWDDSEEEWNSTLWNIYRTVADFLLAMPMPPEE